MQLGQVTASLRSNGLAGTVFELRARLEAKADERRLQRQMPDANPGRSSISDSQSYPAFCLLAATENKVFRRFRRSPIYTSVLEHVTREQGLAYLREAQRGGRLQSAMASILAEDKIGGPRTWRLKGYGSVSPTTLRYIKVATDLNHLFGPLDGMRLAEIGVGYGGQCRVISETWSVYSYDLFDLPEVLALAKRFLKAAGIDEERIVGRDGRDPSRADADLVISNYAFSELTREMQERYFEQVVRHASRGYFTYNHISPPSFRSLTAEEFAERIPGARILPETPKTFKGNVVVVWGAE